MGTNFYLPKSPCPDACEHCSLDGEHIGKRGGGWAFLFHGIPKSGLVTMEDWMEAVTDAGGARDEYGRLYSPDDFRQEVLDTLGSHEHPHRDIIEAEGDRAFARRMWRDAHGFCFDPGEFS